MYCKKCGAQISDDAVFCSKCGTIQNTAGAAQGGAGHTTYAQNAPVNQPTQVYQPGRRPASRTRGCLTTIIILAVFAFLAYFALNFLFGDLFADEGSYDSGYSNGGEYVSTNLDIDVRDHYTKIKGDGTDTVTVMVYMIGSDLESDGGCATNDLIEMINAKVGGNVNVIVQTGGASRWQNDIVSARKVQRWQVAADGLIELGDVGNISMVKSSTVTDFVRFCAKNYPANRYGLILWDHGGGTVWGYGSDENHSGALKLNDIDKALADAGIKFDFVGYDACLMATIENAYMLEKHADYLIASEELEPGDGWDYSGWLPALVSNPSMPTIELGKVIVDSFIAHNSSSDTLSVVELREVPYTYDNLTKFLNETRQALSAREIGFNEVSNARSKAKTYYQGQSEMVDIVDLVSRINTEQANTVIAAVNSAVKYRNNCAVRGSNGLSMYFPYTDLADYSATRKDVSAVGFSDDYLTFFDGFVNMLAGGQMGFRGMTATEIPDYTADDWYDASVADTHAAEVADETYVEKEITEKDDGYVLTMTASEWDSITDIQLWAMLTVDGGYIDLGADYMWERDDNDLLIDFDNTWVALDGQIVPFYSEEVYDENPGDDSAAWYNIGYVPAMLTNAAGEQHAIDLMLRWDNDNPYGFVAGYRYLDETTGPIGKGLRALVKGDKLVFACDKYDADSNYVGTAQIGDELTVGDAMPKVSYEDLGTSETLVCFRLTDVYQNEFFTESVVFTYD